VECFGPDTYPSCGWSRHSFDTVVPARDLNTSYLRQWRDAVDAGLSGAMCSYNAVDGVPACANSKLLKQYMRGEWSFEGMIISDAGAVDGIWGCDKSNPVLHDRQCHNYTHNGLDATAAALNAGCDLNYGSAYGSTLEAAVAKGAVTMDAVKASVKNVFRLRMLTQMESSLTDPSTIPPSQKNYAEIPFSVVDSHEHRQLARDAAAASAVLMVNHNHTLPIPSTARTTITVAIIGEHTGGAWTQPIDDGCYRFNISDPTQCTPFWTIVPAEVLGGSYRGTPAKIDSILESFQRRANHKLKIVHALGVQNGCKAPACNGAHCPPFNSSCSTRHVVINQTERIEAAAAAAVGADYVIMTLVPSQAGESHDRETITLPAVEAEMLAAVAGACQSSRRRRDATEVVDRDCRLVSILFGDGSLSDGRVWSHSDAVLNAFEAGQGGGEAVVSLLTGECNPSGTLHMTVYPEDFVFKNNFTDHSMSAAPGRGARFLEEEPAFRFGHSMSYTNWSETIMQVSPRTLNTDSATPVTVDVVVKNTGAVPGDRAVLLSLRRKKPVGTTSNEADAWPLRWLVDFTKVHSISAGESRSVSLTVTPHEGWLQWVTGEGAAGEFELLLSTEDAASPLTVTVTK
jgi:beta-glucosidase